MLIKMANEQHTGKMLKWKTD